MMSYKEKYRKYKKKCCLFEGGINRKFLNGALEESKRNSMNTNSNSDLNLNNDANDEQFKSETSLTQSDLLNNNMSSFLSNNGDNLFQQNLHQSFFGTYPSNIINNDSISVENSYFETKEKREGFENGDNISCCIEKIGNGSFGIVEKGIDNKNGKTIIIKKIDLGGKNFRNRLLSKEFKNSLLSQTKDSNKSDTFDYNINMANNMNMEQKILSKLKSEISIMEELKHDNIIKYLGHAEKIKNEELDKNDMKNKILEIYMEDICGKSISGISKTMNGLSLELISLYSIQILKALDFIHKKNIIHMDIKGENVLLSNDGVVKLIDFGESIKITKNDNNFRLPYAGSLLFMAPEISNKLVIDIDNLGKSDIWSFGIMLVEMYIGNFFNLPTNLNIDFSVIIKIIIKNLFANVNKNMKNMKDDLISQSEYDNADCYEIFNQIIYLYNKYENYNLLLFLDFVVSCLNFDYTKRKSAEQLLKHPFLMDNKRELNINDYITELFEIPQKFNDLIETNE